MTSDQWNERYTGSGLVWTARPNRFLVSEVEPMNPGRALDLACGEGRNAVWLAGRGWDVTGVDFSAAGIEKGGRLAREHGVEVDWRVADVTAWQPPPEAFDLVIIFYLHVPVPQMGAVLDRAGTALAPGGTLLVVGHALRNLSDGCGGPQDPDLLYTPEDVAGRLTGLILERAEEVERPVEGGGIALDVLVRARRA
jgi:2-polyprenyl-3-methyl-5-hydroxy-6-metoxy-1,4-benzoquinol methylase